MDWDVVVIGGGHAGCEAAHAAARIGCATALVTLNRSRIGFMSCNPAMGGLAKGQLIKEIDALGGLMGINTDKTAIQYRQLNSSKGPAVRSSRAQCDKALYAKRMQEHLETVPGLTILEGEVVDFIREQDRVEGVIFRDGSRARCRAVVVTSGTFLRAVMHTGTEQCEGGRAGDPSSRGLSGALERQGLRLRRLKTGTPPRLLRKSIDWTRVEPQPGDPRPIPFSFYYRPEKFPCLPQVSCYITFTNPQTHEIIDKNTHLSPMYSGAIQGVGPRYCPSIEDKVKRFRERERHQIFLEPEGLDTDEIYVNGVSTSLPTAVQDKFIRTINGLERAEFSRYGYAVEYDAIHSTQLSSSLESKEVQGLFLAGQVNGTSGYEEAGAQGLVAGINAALKCLDREPFQLGREDAYIGVMVDDLILRGADEPYRMFTSRAEYRLILREDNADLRLSEKGWSLGLLSAGDFRTFQEKRARLEHFRERLRKVQFGPGSGLDSWLQRRGSPPLRDSISGEEALRRPEVKWTILAELGADLAEVIPEIGELVETDIKYEGYVRRELQTWEGLRKQGAVRLPTNLNYATVAGISTEARLRLEAARPETLGQASRLQGITPAALTSLSIHLKLRSRSAGMESLG